MVNCSIKMFADDTKLFRTVKSIDDCNILQNDLDTLSQWTNEWLLSFNIGVIPHQINEFLAIFAMTSSDLF